MSIGIYHTWNCSRRVRRVAGFGVVRYWIIRGAPGGPGRGPEVGFACPLLPLVVDIYRISPCLVICCSYACAWCDTKHVLRYRGLAGLAGPRLPHGLGQGWQSEVRDIFHLIRKQLCAVHRHASLGRSLRASTKVGRLSPASRANRHTRDGMTTTSNTRRDKIIFIHASH
jgi:hypothetical protein